LILKRKKVDSVDEEIVDDVDRVDGRLREFGF
jgi:hypothetical protein